MAYRTSAQQRDPLVVSPNRQKIPAGSPLHALDPQPADLPLLFSTVHPIQMSVCRIHKYPIPCARCIPHRQPPPIWTPLQALRIHRRQRNSLQHEIRARRMQRQYILPTGPRQQCKHARRRPIPEPLRGAKLRILDLDTAAAGERPDGHLSPEIREQHHLIPIPPEVAVHDLAHAAAAVVDHRGPSLVVQIPDPRVVVVGEEHAGRAAAGRGWGCPANYGAARVLVGGEDDVADEVEGGGGADLEAGAVETGDVEVVGGRDRIVGCWSSGVSVFVRWF